MSPHDRRRSAASKQRVNRQVVNTHLLAVVVNLALRVEPTQPRVPVIHLCVRLVPVVELASVRQLDRVPPRPIRLHHIFGGKLLLAKDRYCSLSLHALPANSLSTQLVSLLSPSLRGQYTNDNSRAVLIAVLVEKRRARSEHARPGSLVYVRMYSGAEPNVFEPPAEPPWPQQTPTKYKTEGGGGVQNQAQDGQEQAGAHIAGFRYPAEHSSIVSAERESWGPAVAVYSGVLRVTSCCSTAVRVGERGEREN